jgi:hypothetical protein
VIDFNGCILSLVLDTDIALFEANVAQYLEAVYSVSNCWVLLLKFSGKYYIYIPNLITAL